MPQRNIIGTLPNFPNSNIIFTLTPSSISLSTLAYQGLDIRVQTDNNGYFSVNLFTNEENQVTTQYECTLPDKSGFYFFLPAGIYPIDLSLLQRVSQSLPTDPEYDSLISYVNSRLSNVLSYVVPFSFGDASPKIITNSFSGILHEASIIVSQPFNGATPTALTLGDMQQSDSIISAGSVVAELAAEFEVGCDRSYTNAAILLTISLGESVTQGNGYVLLKPLI